MYFRGVMTLLILLLSLPAFAATHTCVQTANPDLCTWIESGKFGPLLPLDISGLSKAISGFYRFSNYNMAWIIGNQPSSQAIAMLQILQDADNEGLMPIDYAGQHWAVLLSQWSQATSPSKSALNQFDLGLTASALKYIFDLHCSPTMPAHSSLGFATRCNDTNSVKFLGRLIRAKDVNKTLSELEPPFVGYRRIKVALRYYLSLAREGDGTPLNIPEEPINPGNRYSSLPQLAERLRRLGDLPRNILYSTGIDIYDGALVEAVKHFQLRHGLSADGILDSETFNELVTPVSHRAFQLRLALKQWRMLSSGLARRFILINIPEFKLQAFDDGRPSLTMRIIAGQASPEEVSNDRRTPLFQGRLEYLVFHPYWNVPSKIVWEEIIPAIQADQGYLPDHNYELVNRQGSVEAPDLRRPGVLHRLVRGDLQIRQRPGPENPLGNIKFVFPNRNSIYLHGTSEQELFSFSRRDFSHGCIRVEDPAALAAWALQDDPSWTRNRIHAVMEQGSEELKAASNAQNRSLKSLKINLRKPITLFIIYQTAVVDENNEAHFFADIYNLDSSRESALRTRRSVLSTARNKQ